MFPFEQSSVSPFGQTNSVFGQNNSSNNPFSPKPFGSTTPFGSQTDSSIFGGTSTGVFGAAQTPSPFGASCSPAFGSSMPAFGSSSTPAFGSSSTSFGGSSGFGQKPTFGGFGSTIPTSVRKLMEAVAGFGSTIGIGKDLEATQTNPFGSATQPSQLAFGFGSSIFGYSTPLDASSQPAFGSTGAPAFGATSTLAFGATSTPEFGATSTSAFGVTSAPAFGATSTPAFVSTSIPASFGSSSSDVYTRVSHPTITEEDGGTSGQTAKLESISAMPSYKYERFDVVMEGL